MSHASRLIISTFFRLLTVNFFFDILSGVSSWYCWHFVGSLTVDYLDIYRKSRVWDNSIIFRPSHGKLSRFFFRASHSEYSLYFVGCLTSKYIDILQGVSLWTISIFCQTFYCEYSQYFFWRLTENDLDIFRTPQGEIPQNVFERFAVNYLAIFSGVSRWMILPGVAGWIILLFC